MNARERQVMEIKQLQTALHNTRSKYAKRDYIKGIRRKKRELRQYDLFQKEGV